MTSTPVIEFSGVSYRVADTRELIHQLNLTIYRGETLALLGRSGSGKTTTLKLINNLLIPTEGTLKVEGKATKDWDVIRLRRMIGYVIQETGLFPHFTVARNIGLVPSIEKWSTGKIQTRVQEMLHLVGLDAQLAARYPRELSGGQRQRVGVARALAADPPILLMEEPFGALDPVTRAELQHEFIALQQSLQKTVVFVTHDLREALLLGTRIALMEEGKLISVVTPKEFLQSNEPLVKQYIAAFGSAGVPPAIGVTK